MYRTFLLTRHKMESEKGGQLCPLCYCFQFKFMNNINVTEKIEKYLQIKMEYSSGNICFNCYKSLEDFHEFYERVKIAHQEFHKDYFAKKGLGKDGVINLGTESPKAKTDNTVEVTNSNTEKEIKFGVIVFNEKESSQNKKKVPFVNCETSDVDNLNEKNSFEKSKLKKESTPSDIEKKMLEFYNVKCEKCEVGEFTSFKLLNKHYMTVHNMQGYINCCKRNIRVNDKYYLRNHMFKHLQPDTCRCHICGKELSSLATLKHHMILHKPNEERPFKCKECSKRFCCKNDLKNHEKAIHIPENEREDYICDVCGKVFQKAANLRYHHSTIHLQEKKYICEICAKCFTTQSGLRTHINAAHSTLDPIQCSICNKWLKTKDTYQKHLQLHQSNSYPCTQCDKICNSSASLRSHLVKHSDKRPYSCTICKKSFKTKTHLKNHSSQHLGGSHYKCPYCSKLFVNMSNYYTHRRRMHTGDKVKSKQESATVEIFEINPLQLYENNVGYKTTKPETMTNIFSAGISRQNIIVSPVKYL